MFFIAVSFLLVTMICIFLTLLALAGLGFMRLESRFGLEHEGLKLGQNAPTWQHFDAEGNVFRSPSQRHWQLLLFANHSLRSFPELVMGINQFARTFRDIEVLIVSRQDAASCLSTRQQLDLHVPILPVKQAF
jgi:hypothetical protein